MHPLLANEVSLRHGSLDVTDERPSACRHVGLDCVSCVNACASRVANLCGHLSEPQQRSIFLKLYPDRVCHGNFPRFQRAYVRHLVPEELQDDGGFDLQAECEPACA